MDQRAVPDFWKGSVEDVAQVVAEVGRGRVSVIARSPGGRDVHLVAYGEPDDLRSQANYNSACGGRDPAAYARKTEGMKPVVLLVGPVHGQEMENVAGLLNLIRVAETGKDWRGRDWPRLAGNIARCRLLIIPCANPDGRARCPYDSWIGVPRQTMTKFGQGTREDGSLYGWPGCKRVHPMVGDVGLLGAYYNDDGINPMHDEFFAPMAEETRGIMEVARTEAPDFAVSLHSHGSPPAVLEPHYVPIFIKEHVQQFGERLMQRYQEADLPAGRVPGISDDGDKFPPPSFNLVSALHHICGAASFTFECCHGITGNERYPRVTFDQIVDIQLLLYDELLQYAVDSPVHWLQEDAP
ncbi:MAG: M14 family zinc carboxypeptidase [Armatimonadota bacterium]